MKLLVVGHSYITACSQSKYTAMKQLHSELQLRLVMPHAVRHVLKTYKPTILVEIHASDGRPSEALNRLKEADYQLNRVERNRLLPSDTKARGCAGGLE